MAMKFMSEIQFLTSHGSVPLKTITELWLKSTNGVKLLTDGDVSKGGLGRVDEETNVLNFKR